MDPNIRSDALCKKKLIPIAVIKTASGGALLSGLYATFSITTPSTAHTITVITSATGTGSPKTDILK